MTNVILAQTAQKYPCVVFSEFIPFTFIPKYEVKNERGRKIMVTTVKTRMALLFDSAMMASSFCSMVRSWKSCSDRNQFLPMQ